MHHIINAVERVIYGRDDIVTSRFHHKPAANNNGMTSYSSKDEEGRGGEG